MTSIIPPPQRPNKSKLRKSAHLNSNESLIPKYQSRFIERFDLLPPLRTPLQTSQSSMTRSMDELQLPIDLAATTPKQRLVLTTSKSSPLVTTTSSSRSMNRANVVISRLESWHMCLKSVVAWLEEVARMNLMSSRGYAQRALTVLDTVSSKKLGGRDEQVNQSIATIQAGLAMLTKRLVAETRELSQVVQKRYVPELTRLSKEVKEKVHHWRHDQTLAMDEFLKRAEMTKSQMDVLSRCCKQAEKAKGSIDIDPWLANLMVLKQLKREVDEENRLRLLMIPVQQDAKDLEERIIAALKPAVEYCYRALAPGAWDDTVTPFKRLLEQITPESDWDSFVELNRHDLVDQDHPTKDYLKINYPNKFHPLVTTVLRGKLKRRHGKRKHFETREFVLSQGGYLHEFTLGSKLTPEKTIYIPNATIVSPVDIDQLVKDNVLLEYGHFDLTFDICKPAANMLQKDKHSTYKASTRSEFVQWCLALRSKSKESFTQPQGSESPFQSRFFPRSRSMKRKTSATTSENSDNASTHLYMRKSHDQQVPFKTDIAAVQSVKEEPTSVKKTPAAANFRVPTKAENEIDAHVMTDTESFVTARLNESVYSDEESGTIDDYFSYVESDSDSSDRSNVTAKVATATDKSSPSMTNSNNFEDAQSSVYDSLPSRPRSQISIHDHASITSMPEFDLLDKAISPSESSRQAGQDDNSNSGKLSEADLYKTTVNLEFY